MLISLIVKLYNFTKLQFIPAPALQKRNARPLLLCLHCCDWLEEKWSGVRRTDTIKAPYLMDRTQEVNMYLSSQIVFSRAICSLRTSQSKSCELNNQWLPFWQPQGYLAEDRERESVYVCYEKGKKLSVAFFDPWRQARTEPFSSFTNFFFPWVTTCHWYQEDKC